LIAAKCDLNVRNRDNETALILICRHEEMNEIFVLLVEAGIDLTATTRKEGMNVLHLCVRAKEAALSKIKALLDHGIAVNTQDRLGRTALHYAVDNGNVDVLQLLLQKGCDINFQDEEGWTVLHHAVSQRAHKLVHELLDWKADVTVGLFSDGYTALHLAFSDISNNISGDLQILHCLVEHKNGYTLDKVNLQTDYGYTALRITGWVKNLSAVEFLLQFIDVRIRNVDGDTALHDAVRNKASQEVIHLLLCSRHGLEAANLLNKKGKAPLHKAILEMNNDAVLALGKVVDVNVQDKHGRTALHYAIQDHQIHYVDMLLCRRMVDVSIQDKEGLTALSLACSIECSKESSLLSIIYQLCKHGVSYGELQYML